MAEQETQRNLLAGILALQLDFIKPEALVVALREWSRARSKSVCGILVVNGHLEAGRQKLIEALVAEHLKQHGDDPAQCLAALSVAESLRDDLLEIADPDIEASLSHVRQWLKHKEEKATEQEFDPYATQDIPPVSATAVEDDADPFKTRILPTAVDPGGVTGPEARSASAERFRVLRLHAKGGLGLVSVAEDGELHREVALKEIQLQHADNLVSRARFLVEAEITGRLEHPGIVPVYGLGQYADGRPYYAMRLIRGESLRKAIDNFHLKESAANGQNEGARLLELRGLLGQFIAVCNTMEYAHSRGILHRDLKPDNIVLGEYGETLVVDWGLAKAVGQSEQGESSDERNLVTVSSGTGETLPGSAIGTPQYMSPEQAAGRLDKLTTTSDVYSLGATLYHLLTGSPPIDRAALGEVLRRVREGDFPSPRARRKSVPPALEAICLKALALEPARRYASARQLAADLEHWLADEPVDVYPEPWLARVARWARRHRAAAQATVAALLVIAVVAVVATLVINTAREREAVAKVEATHRSQQAREVIDTLLTGVGQALENYPSMQEARKRLLERAADDYLRLTDASSADPELRAEAARAFCRLGDVRTVLNQFEKAETAYRSAESHWRALTGRFPQRIDFQTELANCLTRRAIAAATRGKSSEAEAAYQASLGVLEPVTNAHPDDAEAGDALGTVLVNLGRLQGEKGKTKDAEAMLQRAIHVFEKLGDISGSRPRIRSALAAARNAFGRFLVARGREKDAIPIFQEAIKVNSQLVSAQPGEAEHLAARAASRLALAAAYRDAGRSEDEVATYRRTVEDYSTLLAALPDVPRYRENLAVTRTNLGQGLHKLGQNRAALDELKLSLAQFDVLASEFPSVSGYLEGLAATRTTLASTLRELAQFDDAKTEIDAALTQYRQLVAALPDVPGYHAGLGVALSHRARILSRLAALPEAEQEFRQATAQLQRAVSIAPDDPHFRDSLAAVCGQWAWLRHAAGDSPGCRAAQEQSLTLLDGLAAGFPNSARFADSAAWLLTTGPAAELRDLRRAASLAGRATSLVPLNDFFWRTLGAVQYESHDYATARVLLKKAHDLRPSEEGLTVFLRAMTEWQLGEKDAARELYDAAVAWSDQNKPGDEELQRFRAQAAALFGTKVTPVPSH